MLTGWRARLAKGKWIVITRRGKLVTTPGSCN